MNSFFDFAKQKITEGQSVDNLLNVLNELKPNTLEEKLFLARILCQREYKVLDILKSDFFDSNPVDELLSSSRGVYEELVNFVNPNVEYPKKIPFISAVNKIPSYYVPGKELFPIGLAAIKDHSYLEHCHNSPFLGCPNLTLIKCADTSIKYCFAVFYSASAEYIKGFDDLISSNIADYMSGGIVHIHCIDASKEDIESTKLYRLPNVSITSSSSKKSRFKVAYYMGYRYVVLSWIRGLHRLPIFLLGCDVVLAKHVLSLVSGHEDCINLYNLSPHRYITPWRSMYGDCFYIPFNNSGSLFTKIMCNYIFGHNQDFLNYFYLDQVSLTMTYNYMAHSLKMQSEFSDMKSRIPSVCMLNSTGSPIVKTKRAIEWRRNFLIKQSEALMSNT